MVFVWFRTLNGAVAHANVPELCTGRDLRRALGQAIGEPVPCGVRLFAGGERVADTAIVRPQPDEAFLAVLSVPCILADILGRDAEHLTGVPYVAAAAREGCEADLRAACERARNESDPGSAAHAAARILADALSSAAAAPDAAPEPDPEPDPEPEGRDDDEAPSESSHESEGGSDSEAAALESTHSLLRALSHLVRGADGRGDDAEDGGDGGGDGGDDDRGGRGRPEGLRGAGRRGAGLVPRMFGDLPDDGDAFLEHMLMSAAREHAPRDGSSSSSSARGRDRSDPFRRLPTRERLVGRVHRLARAARAHGVRFADPRAAARAVPEDLVAQLVAVMGDGEERRVRRALRLARMNADVALNMLLDGDPRLLDDDGDDGDDGGSGGGAGAGSFDPEASDADAELLLLASEDVRHAVMGPFFDEALALAEAGDVPPRSDSGLHDTVRRLRALLGLQ